jgi:hypothetical protein
MLERQLHSLEQMTVVCFAYMLTTDVQSIETYIFFACRFFCP